MNLLDHKLKSVTPVADEPGAFTIVIIAPDGKETSYLFDDCTDLQVYGGPNELSVLALGDPVHVEFQADGDKLILDSVTARRLAFKPRRSKRPRRTLC